MANFLKKKSMFNVVDNNAKKLACTVGCSCSGCPNGSQTDAQILKGTENGRKQSVS